MIFFKLIRRNLKYIINFKIINFIENRIILLKSKFIKLENLSFLKSKIKLLKQLIDAFSTIRQSQKSKINISFSENSNSLIYFIIIKKFKIIKYVESGKILN